MSAQFDKAVAIIKDLPSEGPAKPTTDEKLQYYGYFKQANEGDVTGARPGPFSFEGRAKWDAWKKNEGLSKDEAKQKYVDLLKSKLMNLDDESSKKYLAELEAAA